MHDRRIAVVGSLNADHRVRVARIPAAGETVLGSDIIAAAGGKGANQAVAAARAGATARIIGVIGDDRDGELIRDALAGSNVDTRHVRTVSGTPTGRALISVDTDGENTIVVSTGANGQLTPDDIAAGLDGFGTGDLVLLQLETPEPLVRHAARTAADVGCTVVLNAAPVPTSIDGLFDHVHVLVVNEHELASITDLLRDEMIAARDPRDAMAQLAAAADAAVICTAGNKGAFFTHGGRVAHVEAPAVDAVDTTAAGDTFIGYFAAGLAAAPDDTAGAIKTAVQAAGISVTRAGAIDSIPYRHELGTTKGQR